MVKQTVDELANLQATANLTLVQQGLQDLWEAHLQETGEVPLVAIIQFRDDKVAHEYIYWDQASVLVQLGLLDPDTLPVVGVESARKLLDPNLPSNALIDRWCDRYLV